MENVSVSWEDDENNRVVEFSVECRMNEDSVEIGEITPKTVTFVDPQTRQPVRQISVWTEAGRRHLVNKYQAKVSGELLEAKIETSLMAVAN